MFKNVASQKLTLLAIDTAANTPKTGDAANLTAYVSKDDGTVTVLGDTSATELDATNAPGLYSFDLAQAETNADKVLFSGKSSTTGIRVIPLLLYTLPSGGVASPTNITGASGVALAASQHVIVDSGTVTNLTNLPTVPTDWLTAAGVKADAVAKIQAGLSTYAGGDTPGTTEIVGKLPAGNIADESLVIAATSAILADLVKVLAAVYDSASASGDVITLSNGHTLTISATGRVLA